MSTEAETGIALQWRTIAFVAIGWAVVAFFPVGIPALFVILSMHAFRGPRASIEALTLMCLLLIVNPGINSVLHVGNTFRWLVLFAALGRALWDGYIVNMESPKTVTATLSLFAGIVVLLSLSSSYSPQISVLKLVAVYITVYTILICLHRTSHLHSYWTSWFFNIFLAVMAISLPYYFTETGFYHDRHGFQGILVHPQTFGPVAAPFAAWALARLLFGDRRCRFSWVVLSLAIFAIATAHARTAVVMFGGTFLLIFILELVRNGISITALRLAGTGAKLGIVAVLMSVLLLGLEVSRTSALDFVIKRGADQRTFAESFEESRGFLIATSMENFRSSPLGGIGFGLPSDPDRMQWTVRTGPGGIPVGAPTEKGFFGSAILEEIGLIGTVAFLCFFVSLVRPIVRSNSPELMAVSFSSLLVNVGEMIIFSPGGMGLLFWLLIGFAFTEARRRNNTQTASE